LGFNHQTTIKKADWTNEERTGVVKKITKPGKPEFTTVNRHVSNVCFSVFGKFRYPKELDGGEMNCRRIQPPNKYPLVNSYRTNWKITIVTG
jgi:hypothetical protein